ncbi:hypothetical protein JST97_20245 [bacterium]|nr:hypothetical protein [bacterium]
MLGCYSFSRLARLAGRISLVFFVLASTGLAKPRELKSEYAICIFSASPAQHESLLSSISRRRDALRLARNEEKNTGIFVLKQTLPTELRIRLGVGDQAMPCYAIVWFNAQGSPERIAPNAIQRNVLCSLDADLMISRLLNLLGEQESQKQTGLDVESLHEILNLSAPDQTLVYCVGRDVDETVRMSNAFDESRRRNGFSADDLPRVARQSDYLSDALLDRLGIGRSAAPFFAYVRNSGDGNPSVVVSGSAIRNVEDIAKAAEGMCYFKRNGSLPTEITKQLPPIAIESSRLTVRGRSVQEAGASAGDSLSYALGLNNIRAGPDRLASVQLTTTLFKSDGSKVGNAYATEALRPELNQFSAKVTGVVALPSSLEPGDYKLQLDAMDTYSLQTASVAFPLKVGSAAPPPAAAPVHTDRLNSGSTLYNGESLISQNGRFKLHCQSDGNIVLYDGNRPIWNTSTNNQGAKLLLDGNGFLRVAGGNGQVIWTGNGSGSWGNYSLCLQNDGNLVLYRESGGGATPVWASQTGARY